MLDQPLHVCMLSHFAFCVYLFKNLLLLASDRVQKTLQNDAVFSGADYAAKENNYAGDYIMQFFKANFELDFPFLRNSNFFVSDACRYKMWCLKT